MTEKVNRLSSSTLRKAIEVKTISFIFKFNYLLSNDSFFPLFFKIWCIAYFWWLTFWTSWGTIPEITTIWDDVLKDKLWHITILESLFEHIVIHESSSFRLQAILDSTKRVWKEECYRVNEEARQRKHLKLQHHLPHSSRKLQVRGRWAMSGGWSCSLTFTQFVV